MPEPCGWYHHVVGGQERSVLQSQRTGNIPAHSACVLHPRHLLHHEPKEVEPGVGIHRLCVWREHRCAIGHSLDYLYPTVSVNGAVGRRTHALLYTAGPAALQPRTGDISLLSPGVTQVVEITALRYSFLPKTQSRRIPAMWLPKSFSVIASQSTPPDPSLSPGSHFVTAVLRSRPKRNSK